MTRTLLIFSIVMLFTFLSIARSVYASSTNGTIDATLKYAWSNNVGWINFATTHGNVHVTDSELTGYIWDSLNGSVNLAPSHSGVTNNGEGTLGGQAWSTGLGWINFSGVTIDSNGRFHGQATGHGIGILTFDCTHCEVVTDWRPVSARNPSTPPSGGSGGNGLIIASFGGGIGIIPALPATGGTSTLVAIRTPLMVTTITACVYQTSNENPDITRDGKVNIFDFNSLMVTWGTSGVQPADITHDCMIDIFDFNALMVAWSS